MKKLFEFWWDRGNKCLSLINYRKSWSENDIDPKISYHTNGSVKGNVRDFCLDVTVTIGYLVFNYTDYRYNHQYRKKSAPITTPPSIIKRRY